MGTLNAISECKARVEIILSRDGGNDFNDVSEEHVHPGEASSSTGHVHNETADIQERINLVRQILGFRYVVDECLVSAKFYWADFAESFIIYVPHDEDQIEDCLAVESALTCASAMTMLDTIEPFLKSHVVEVHDALDAYRDYYFSVRAGAYFYRSFAPVIESLFSAGSLSLLQFVDRAQL